nr:uncharacterized protein LOC111504687 [Leptinotarsa decemlineata]
MIITGAASVVPVICGENSGQHIYLTVDGTNPIQIVISTGTTVTLGRSWNIKVTQIDCDCPTLAPIGCLQYYTELTNTVNSFNYGNGLNGNLVTQADGTIVAGTRQIANQRYGICVGMTPGYCSIRWAQTADTTSFTLTGDTAATALMPGLPGNPGVGEACTTDYVVIPNPFMTTGAAEVGDRFCGNQLNTVVTFSKPFVLNVVTDANEATDAANRGFSLTYTQLPCSTTSNLFFTG